RHTRCYRDWSSDVCSSDLLRDNVSAKIGLDDSEENSTDEPHSSCARGPMSDLRHAWRSIARMPLLAIVVVSSLAVGIGVNTAVFSWVQALFLRPLPGVADAGRLYLVEPRTETGSYPGASWPEYNDLRMRMRALPD